MTRYGKELTEAELSVRAILATLSKQNPQERNQIQERVAVLCGPDWSVESACTLSDRGGRAFKRGTHHLVQTVQDVVRLLVGLAPYRRIVQPAFDQRLGQFPQDPQKRCGRCMKDYWVHTRRPPKCSCLRYRRAVDRGAIADGVVVRLERNGTEVGPELVEEIDRIDEVLLLRRWFLFFVRRCLVGDVARVAGEAWREVCALQSARLALKTTLTRSGSGSSAPNRGTR